MKPCPTPATRSLLYSARAPDAARLPPEPGLFCRPIGPPAPTTASAAAPPLLAEITCPKKRGGPFRLGRIATCPLAPGRTRPPAAFHPLPSSVVSPISPIPSPARFFFLAIRCAGNRSRLLGAAATGQASRRGEASPAASRPLSAGAVERRSIRTWIGPASW